MKQKTNDNKTIKQESAKLLLDSLLKSEINPLVKRETEILTEVLVNGKTFSELVDIFNLTPSRQKIIVQRAVRRLNTSLANVGDKLKKYDELLPLYQKLQKEKAKKEILEAKKKPLSPELKKILNTPITQSGLSKRVQNICAYGNINLVSDLAKLHIHDLIRLRNTGRKAITEIQDFLNNHKLHLGMDI